MINRLVKFQLLSFSRFGFRAFQSFEAEPFLLKHPLYFSMSFSEAINAVTGSSPDQLPLGIGRRNTGAWSFNVCAIPVEYPVEEQASKVDNTPIHNIGIERQWCGKVGHHLLKLGNLQAVSRSIIVQRAGKMRAGSETSFSGFKDAVKARDTFVWLQHFF